MRALTESSKNVDLGCAKSVSVVACAKSSGGVENSYLEVPKSNDFLDAAPL